MSTFIERGRRWLSPFTCLLLVLTTLAACDRKTSQEPSTVSLDVFVDGATLHRLVGTLRDTDAPMRLWHDTSQDGGVTWSPAVEVAPPGGAPIKTVHRGEDAKIVARGRDIMAVWPGQGGGVFGSGPLGCAISTDGGVTWIATPDPAPFDPDGSQKQGARFPALAADAEGFHLVWIDASDDKRSVRYARYDLARAGWTPPQVIDETSCACCWNTLEVAPDGRVVFVYRDESPRDMKIILSGDRGKGWSQPLPVGDFGWAFEGCPHVGAGLAVSPVTGRHHALVWTGLQGNVGLHALHRAGGDGPWSTPQKLGSDRATHPRLAATDDGTVVAVWSETGASDTRIFTAMSHDDGQTWTFPQPVSEAGSFASHALVARAGWSAFVTWTQDGADNTSSVHATRLPLHP